MSENEYTVFPSWEKKLTVIELYERIFESFPSQRNEIFLSGPITSGGARKLYQNWLIDDHQTLDAISVVARHNSLFFEVIAREIKALFAGRQITIPTRLNAPKQWEQYDFIQFWMYYLCGVSPNIAHEFEKHLNTKNIINMSLFNSFRASQKERFQEYRKLMTEFITFNKSVRGTLKPVSLIIFMPDTEQSLGSHFEFMLARACGIERKKILFDRKHARFPKHIAKIAPWLTQGKHPAVQDHSGEHLILFSFY